MALAGRPMLDHVLERALETRGVSEVLLATGPDPRDIDALWPLAWKRNCRTHCCENEWDVLRRIWECAEKVKAGAVLRITADCPFWAPDVGSTLVEQFEGADVDYLSNDTTHSGYPDGTDAELFTLAALRSAHASATERGDREHVTPWIRKNMRTGMVHYLAGDFSWMKLSVDRQEDYDRARRLADLLPPHDHTLSATLAAYAQMSEAR
jgi:spore coat polysaccharide biosynthesis protein SpsF (cytidylyltransferase family)